MAEHQIALKTLRLENVFQFDEFVLNFERPGVHLVTGNNGSGKSNIARSLQWLIDPQAAREQFLVKEESMLSWSLRDPTNISTLATSSVEIKLSNNGAEQVYARRFNTIGTEDVSFCSENHLVEDDKHPLLESTERRIRPSQIVFLTEKDLASNKGEEKFLQSFNSPSAIRGPNVENKAMARNTDKRIQAQSELIEQTRTDIISKSYEFTMQIRERWKTSVEEYVRTLDENLGFADASLTSSLLPNVLLKYPILKTEQLSLLFSNDPQRVERIVQQEPLFMVVVDSVIDLLTDDRKRQFLDTLQSFTNNVLVLSVSSSKDYYEFASITHLPGKPTKPLTIVPIKPLSQATPTDIPRDSDRTRMSVAEVEDSEKTLQADWQTMRYFEQRLRHYVIDSLGRTYGSEWFVKGFPERTKIKTRQQMKEDLSWDPSIEGEPEFNPTRYLSLHDYSEIIELCWDPVFRKTFKNLKTFKRYYRPLEVYRNAALGHEKPFMIRNSDLRQNFEASLIWFDRILSKDNYPSGAS